MARTQSASTQRCAAEGWGEAPHLPSKVSPAYPVGSVDPATLSDPGMFAPFFAGSIDLQGEHRTEARHAWAAVKANGVDLRLDYMLLDSYEDDGAAPCKSWT